MKEIELKIEQKEQELIHTNYDHKIQLERDMLVQRLHKHMQNVGAKIKRIAKWVEQGEKNPNISIILKRKTSQVILSNI